MLALARTPQVPPGQCGQSLLVRSLLSFMMDPLTVIISLDLHIHTHRNHAHTLPQCLPQDQLPA